MMIVQDKDSNMKEMLGGCCVCSDDRGWTENPLVYCDGIGCSVAVHQACYGIVSVPTGNWYCRKCESSDVTKVKCELCPSREGALKPTDNARWAHVVCALYIPEVRFGNVTTMEPIITHQVPPERFNKVCYICESENKGTRSTVGACMQCNRPGCRQQFHVTCAQSQGLLCEEAGSYQDNVKYCGYCLHHYTRLKKGANVKVIPPYRPVSSGGESPDHEDSKSNSHKRKIIGGHSRRTLGEDTSGSIEGAEESGEGSKAGGTNGAPPDPDHRPPSLAKKRKGESPVGGRSSTPQESPSESPRPVTPSAVVSVALVPPLPAVTATLPPPHPTPPPKPNTPPSTNGSIGSKVSSIVVQVPLEAAQLAGGLSSPGAVSPPVSTSPGPLLASIAPPPITAPQDQPLPTLPLHPSKRSRSESTEKEKRRSKRSGSSSTSSRHSSQPHSSRKSPTSRMKLSPEPRRPSSSGSASEGSHKPRPSLSVPQPKEIKEEKDTKLFENGLNVAPHMLGNQLAPGSLMADTLSQEVAAHSIYTRTSSTNHQGPHFPRPAPYRGPASTGSNNLTASAPLSTGGGSSAVQGLSWGGPNNTPQSLEQLLERQWEQGSQFLMEQASHFDIASLLSCLHQLRAENAQLEEHVNTLLARRDHLLAVNARLAIPLVPNQVGASGGNNLGLRGGAGGVGGVAPTVSSAALTNSVTSIVENGLATPHEQYRAATMHRVGVESSSRVGGYNSGAGQVQSSVVVRAGTAPPAPHTPTPQHLSAPHPDPRNRAPNTVGTGTSGYQAVNSYQGQPSPSLPSHHSQVVMRGREETGSQMKPS